MDGRIRGRREQHLKRHAPAEEGWRQTLGDSVPVGLNVSSSVAGQVPLPTVGPPESLCTNVPPPVADVFYHSRVQGARCRGFSAMLTRLNDEGETFLDETCTGDVTALSSWRPPRRLPRARRR